MTKPLNIGMEEPFHKGYIVIPKAWIEKAEELTEHLSVIPNINGVNTKEKRRLKTTLIAIDMLNKIKNKTDTITSKKIAEMLDVDAKEVDTLIQDAIDSGMIEESKDGKLIIRCIKKYVAEEESKKKKPGEHKQLITMFHDKFLAKFKEKPALLVQDFSAATSLIKNYSIEELGVIIDKYFELPNDFLKSAGYKLRYIPNSINSIAVANSDNKTSRRTKKIYKGEDYVDEISREQLEDYIDGKKLGSWTGKEPWAKAYEEAIAKGDK